MYARVALMLLLIAQPVNSESRFPEELKKVGEAALMVLWFDIYDARLFNSEGVFAGIEGRLMLTLNYKRSISVADLLEETQSQLEMSAEPALINRWITQLEMFWVSVSKGDQLAFYIDEQSAGHFFFNREWIGVIKEPDFSQAFINIWLSEKSAYPRLAKRLRGEFNNEKID